jgi:hypothetical protein
MKQQQVPTGMFTEEGMMKMKRRNKLAPWLWMAYFVVLLCLTATPGFAQNKKGNSTKSAPQAAQTQTPQVPPQAPQTPTQTPPTAAPADALFDAVLAGKACRDDEATQALTCEYKVGTGLHFLIEGLGQPDTGITFLKSSADEDFFASFAVLHGCVIVSRGEKSRTPADVLDFVFVSPKNGKVYRSWEECKEGW